MPITHLTRNEGEMKLHISHIFRYVSAYEYCDEMLNQLIEQIEYALQIAAHTIETQIVDQDGECCLHITPAGHIILMLPWKTYQVADE